MKCKLTSAQPGPDGIHPAGTEIEHPDCHRLVALGVAEPIDDECKAEAEAWKKIQAKRSPAQKDLHQMLRRAQRAASKRAEAEAAG